MNQALVIGTMPYLYEGRMQGTPSGDFMLPHSMIINRHARRFRQREDHEHRACIRRARCRPRACPFTCRRGASTTGSSPGSTPTPCRPGTSAGVRHEDRTLEGLARKIDGRFRELGRNRSTLQRVRAHRRRRGLRARLVDLGSGAPRRPRSRPPIRRSAPSSSRPSTRSPSSRAFSAPREAPAPMSADRCSTRRAW